MRLDPSRYIGAGPSLLAGRLVRDLLAGLTAAVGVVVISVPQAIGRTTDAALGAATTGIAGLVTAPFDLGVQLLTAAGVASAAGTGQFGVLALVAGWGTVLLTLFVLAWGVSALVGE